MVTSNYDIHGMVDTNDDENDVDVTLDQGWMICLPGNRALEACHIATHTPPQ